MSYKVVSKSSLLNILRYGVPLIKKCEALKTLTTRARYLSLMGFHINGNTYTDFLACFWAYNEEDATFTTDEVLAFSGPIHSTSERNDDLRPGSVGLLKSGGEERHKFAYLFSQCQIQSILSVNISDNLWR